MKNETRIIGSEALFLLASSVVAGIAAMIQMIGRRYDGDYSGFIFSGSNYTYNVFFYIAGLIIFVGFMIAGYRFYLQKRISSIGKSGVVSKVIFSIVALVFALVMLATLVLCFFLIIGLNDNMKPDVLFQLTGFGWPIFSLIFMIVVEVLNCKS